MRLRVGFVVLATLVFSGGCELVLGTFPPVRDNPDAGPGGAGGSASTTTATSPGGGSGGACCDCDGDGVPAIGLCGGTDCDDHEHDAYPGAPAYHGAPTNDPAVGFDWDCSGVAEPSPMLFKTVSCGLVALPCSADTGYLMDAPPPCGESGPWGTCKQQGIGCVNAVIEPSKVMICR